MKWWVVVHAINPAMDAFDHYAIAMGKLVSN
jgi:hypothetical protein